MNGQSFNVTLYFFLKISNKICYEVLKIFLGTTDKAMADRENKRGRQIYKNLNISRKKIAF